MAANDLAGATTIYRDALQRYPQSKALVYGTPKRCLPGGNTSRAQLFLESQLQLYSSDYKLYGLQAKNLRGD
jgi:predicted Zn-dependent protease